LRYPAPKCATFPENNSDKKKPSAAAAATSSGGISNFYKL